MKYLDDVKVINDNYKELGIKKGYIGTIIDPDIRWDSFYVCFQDQRVYDTNFMSKQDNIFKLDDDICEGIKIQDLELVKDNKCSDALIEKDLPASHKHQWCKVENGYITNLKGERKNKTPFKYDEWYIYIA